jgi:tetratricopeptide (TPR) repeat protein
MRSRALAQLVLALIYGPADAATLAREITEMKGEDLGPYVAAFVDLGQAELNRLSGDFDEARRLARKALDGFGSLGMGAVQGGLAQDLGQIELSAGEPLAALTAFLRSDTILAEQGESALRSTTQALLADAHERLGHLDAARAAIELSDQLSAPEDLTTFVITRQVRARLALADRDTAAAERWARSAVEHACLTDFHRFTAGARLDLARVLSALQRPEEAKTEARGALDLYQSKGDRPGIAQAIAILDALSTLN